MPTQNHTYRFTALYSLHPKPYTLKSFTFSAKERDTETGLRVTSLRSVSSLWLGNWRTSSHCTRSLRRFGSRYYSSDLSIWLSVDPQAAKYPGLSPFTYCANNPVKLVDPNGEACGIPPFGIGTGIGIGIVVDGLIYKHKAMRSTMTISNNYQTVRHYYFGGGSKENLDSKFATTLMNTPRFKNMHQKIISGKNIDAHGNVRTSGSFSIDMTKKEDAFFIGRTGVNYEITTSDDNRKCTVTYTLFMKGSGPDDFSDSNFIMEQNTNDKNSKMRIGGDGMGPNLELGGDPYKFKSQQKSITFDNPGIYE